MSVANSAGTDITDYSARNIENLDIRVGAIRASSVNPRKRFDEDGMKELCSSIQEHGILEPIVVRWIEAPHSIYEIIAGERRWRAAQLAELEYIPCRVMDVDDRKALELALVENLVRRDIDPIEGARRPPQ